MEFSKLTITFAETIKIKNKMKKLLILAVIAGAFTMTSCKKIYKCACTVNGTTTEYSSGVKVSKASAKTWCTALAVGGGTCSLK